MKVQVYAIRIDAREGWHYDWLCQDCSQAGCGRTWELAYLAGRFHATAVHGPQTIRVLDAEVVPEWETILIAFLKGETEVIDFRGTQIPRRLHRLLAAAVRGGW